MDSSLWSQLPEDIQLMAALKLPFPDSSRARLVCKGWYNRIPGLKTYSWMTHLICKQRSQEADFSYLPDHLRLQNIISCSRDGLMLLKTLHSVSFKYESPLVVTNPSTRRWHRIPYPMPPDLQFTFNLHASIHDTTQSFTVIFALSSGHLRAPIQGFWVCVYTPETGWEVKHVNLGESELVVLCKTSLMQPMVFDGDALHFLTVPSSTGFHDTGEYTLNRVSVLVDDSERFRLKKLHSWTSLPRGMWPGEKRVHPKLVLCSGQLLLAGVSFEESGQQGPVVFLRFEMETKSWGVLCEVSLPGYVARPLIRQSNTWCCDGGKRCGQCYCYQDLLVTAWDEEVLMAFGDSEDERLTHDFSYDLSTRSLSKFIFPKLESPSPLVYLKLGSWIPVTCVQLVRVHLSSRGRLPEMKTLQVEKPPRKNVSRRRRKARKSGRAKVVSESEDPFKHLKQTCSTSSPRRIPSEARS